MNDWWNDPPEQPEIPPCPECEDEVEWQPGNGGVVCPKCGYLLKMDSDVEVWPIVEEDFGPPILQPALCPHGNPWGECDKCDFEGDIAYDTAREKRMR